MILGRVLWPLWQAILFFEKNDTSMISIFSILEQIEKYWNQLKTFLINKKNDENSYDANRWTQTNDFLIAELNFRRFHIF